MPVPKQRLIFQGKLLQNLEKLKSYKIADESVIHLVAKSMDDGGNLNNLNNTNNTSSVNNQNGTSENSEGRINIEDIFPTLIEMPILRSSRRQRRRRALHFDISDCFESMHQNISCIQNMFNCKSKYDESSVSQTRTITAYDLTKSKYDLGQWVDVKDTIDQWLEAQVIAVRPNQAFVHYNGWGTRWDEWIDFSSPRIAPFKTYTMQSGTSVFLSPYPHVACDANVEAQPRSIDTFYYMEKTFNFVGEIGKIVDYMSRLRKKNINHVNQGRSLVKIDDFETDSKEARDKESQALQRNTQLSLNNNDFELLYYFTQLIPLMDRCGRLLSDVSLQVSHLLLNPSLYPQLLLGYNNQEVSDTMSCTSGYSMYTNEGSTVSGFNQMHFLSEQNNISNNLQRGIVNSNQMINNYSNSNQITSYNNNNINLTHNEGGNRASSFNMDSFPKINLQVPSMLSPGEVVMYNGYNSLLEPNIDIYVHTLVSNNNTSSLNANNSLNTNNSQTNSTNLTSQNTILTTANQVPQNQNSMTSPTQNINSQLNYNNQIFSESDLVENRREQNSNSNSVSNVNTNNTQREAGLNGLLENLMTMIGQRRRGSVTSDTSNNSSRLGRETLSNVNPTTSTTRNRVSNPRPNNSTTTNALSIGSLYRETGTQTDMTLHLLLNKENK